MRLIDADVLKEPIELQRASYARIGAPERAEAYVNCLWEIAQAPTVKLWHVFFETKDGKMSVECIPNNGERFLLYRKRSNWFSIEEWDDDYWTEYACTGDGYDIEEGDAWMELSEPPEVSE